jgi:hypothetical protein
MEHLNTSKNNGDASTSLFTDDEDSQSTVLSQPLDSSEIVAILLTPCLSTSPNQTGQCKSNCHHPYPRTENVSSQQLLSTSAGELNQIIFTTSTKTTIKDHHLDGAKCYLLSNDFMQSNSL